MLLLKKKKKKKYENKIIYDIFLIYLSVFPKECIIFQHLEWRLVQITQAQTLWDTLYPRIADPDLTFEELPGSRKVLNGPNQPGKDEPEADSQVNTRSITILSGSRLR